MSMDAYTHRTVPGATGGALLFLFHGTGGDENQLVGLGRDLLAQAWLVSPRGDICENGAARFFRRTAEGVYDMEDLARATAKMAGFARAHIEAVKPSSVIGLGYSNGANILASTLFEDPGLFDDVVLLHPLIPFEPRVNGDIAGKRILVSAGRRDPICPPNLTARLDSYLRAAGADATLEWHEGGHEIRQDEIEAVLRFLDRHQSAESAQ